MAELIVEDMILKKGERGNYNFEIYESDATTRRNGTGNTYTLRVWDGRSTTESLKITQTLTADDAANGKYHYPVATADTANVVNWLGEIIENIGTANELASNTFNVIVKKSSSGLT